MIHQDLTTWFDSSVHVNETYIEGRPCLGDLIRSGRGLLKDPRLRVRDRHDYHGIPHPMNHYSKTSSHSVDDYSRISHTSKSYPSKYNCIGLNRENK